MKFHKGHVSSSKLTPEQVYRMRELYATGEWSQGRLAREFQVSIGQVGRIVRGEVWQNFVKPEVESEVFVTARPPSEEELARGAEESFRRLTERLSQPPKDDGLAPQARDRAAAYGGKVSGLDRLAKELERQAPSEEEQKALDELDKFLDQPG